MQYRPDIDGLRAVAVLPVVLYHAGLVFPGGFVGVDVFFVISGYLITAILTTELEAGRFSLAAFYERRARRLFPALFAMVAATAVTALMIMAPEDLERFGRSAAATTLFLANFHFHAETGYFRPEAHLTPLLHAWSLAVEEQFYLVFPLGLLIGWRLAPRLGLAPRPWLIAATAAGAAASFALAVRWAPWGEAAFYLPHPRAWELALGALLAMTVGPGRPPLRLPRRAAEALAAGGLAAILWAALSYDAGTLFPGWTAAVPCLGTAAVILAGAARIPGDRPTAAARLLSTAPMLLVGKMSYSLYLWHWPVLVFAAYGLIRPLHPVETALALALSAALAWASWRFIETPVRTRRALPTRRAVAGVSVAAAVMLTAAGAAISAADGLPGRLPEDLRPFVDRSRLHADRAACALTPARVQGEMRVCTAGASDAAPSFVLLGDSHAIDLAPGLFAAAEELGLAGWRFHSDAILPLPGRRSPNFGAEPVAEAFADFLAARPEIDRVVISAFWLFQGTGHSHRHFGDYRVDDACPQAAERCSRASLVRGLSNLFAAFPEVRFVLLDDTPSGRALHLPDQLRIAASGRGDRPEGLPRAEAEAQRAVYAPLLAEAAEAHPNAVYRPLLLEALCGPELCPLFDGQGRPLYWDGDHLSVIGALSLAPALQAALKD